MSGYHDKPLVDELRPPTQTITAVNAIPQLVSRPDSFRCHMLTDSELDGLMKLEKPFASGISTTSLGAFLGLIPQIIEAIKDIRASSPISPDRVTEIVIYAILCTGTLLIFLMAGWIAIQGKSEGKKMLEAIRNRPMQPMG